MSFLIFNDKTQEITIRSEMNRVRVIDALRSVDNSEDKSFFKEALKYIYHSYKKDHSFYNLSIYNGGVSCSQTPEGINDQQTSLITCYYDFFINFINKLEKMPFGVSVDNVDLTADSPGSWAGSVEFIVFRQK